MRGPGGYCGRYELLHRVASGGMADVYLARVNGPAGFARRVIVKAMRGDDDDARAMFLDEARLLARLHHHGIAQVYDLIATDDGELYLAMEYVHGHTLAAVMHRADAGAVRIPLDFALTVVEATATALHHAHECRDDAGRPLGIVHRDVTPGNIMAAFDGAVKLIDFGIATAFERTTETESGVIKGKTRYMAPEQVRGTDVDRRTDVFGLGAVLYELTTQRRAFPLASPVAIAERQVVPPSVVRPGYHPALEDIVMTALARDPGYRFPDADALARALRAAAGQLGLALAPATVVRTMTRLFDPHEAPWRAAHAILRPPLPARRAPVIQVDGSTGATVTRADDGWAIGGPGVPALRARRHPVSWGVVPATGALADWEATVDTKDATSKFLSLEVEPPEVPEAFAVGSWDRPRLAAHAELGAGESEVILLEVEDIEDAAPTPRATAPARPARRPAAPEVVQTRTMLTRTRDRRWLPLAAASIAALAAIGGVLAVRGDRTYTVTTPAPASRIAAPAPAPPAPVPPVAAPPARVTEPTVPGVGGRAGAPASAPEVPGVGGRAGAPRSIRFKIATDPPDATVLVDGDRLGRSPLTVELPREPGPVRVKIRRRGYRTKIMEVSLDRDVSLHVDLEMRGGRRR